MRIWIFCGVTAVVLMLAYGCLTGGTAMEKGVGSVRLSGQNGDRPPLNPPDCAPPVFLEVEMPQDQGVIEQGIISIRGRIVADCGFHEKAPIQLYVGPPGSSREDFPFNHYAPFYDQDQINFPTQYTFDRSNGIFAFEFGTGEFQIGVILNEGTRDIRLIAKDALGQTTVVKADSVTITRHDLVAEALSAIHPNRVSLGVEMIEALTHFRNYVDAHGYSFDTTAVDLQIALVDEIFVQQPDALYWDPLLEGYLDDLRALTPPPGQYQIWFPFIIEANEDVVSYIKIDIGAYTQWKGFPLDLQLQEFDEALNKYPGFAIDSGADHITIMQGEQTLADVQFSQGGFGFTGFIGSHQIVQTDYLPPSQPPMNLVAMLLEETDFPEFF